jgi:hypothetical protein
MKRSDHPANSRQIRELIALGRRSARRAFPNPDRRDCPDLTLLREMAKKDLRLGVADLPISHVVTCSPCFRQYMRYRRFAVLTHTVRQAMPYAAALGLIVLAVLLSLKYSGSIVRRGGERHSQAKSSPKMDSPTTAPATQVRIDLAAFSPTRGTGTESPQPIHLFARLLHMTIRLPLGMEPGEYAIQLKDATGVVYADTHVTGRVIEGTTSLDLNLDLSAVSEGRGALMIRPPGRSWRTYAVVIK